jgi:septal ring factor EnvC (AmiA/AmiB activator)
MKRVLTILCLFSALALIGCSDNSANLTPEQKQTISQFQSQLDQIKTQIDEQTQKAANLQADAKAAIEKMITEAKAKLSEAQTKLDELKKASTQEWDKAKANVDAALKSARAVLSQNVSLPAIPKLPGQ